MRVPPHILNHLKSNCYNVIMLSFWCFPLTDLKIKIPFPFAFFTLLFNFDFASLRRR